MAFIRSQHDWTEKHISRFWDWISQSKYWQSKYFTKQVGLGLSRFIKKNVKFKGDYLDYGCGSGHLLELFLNSSTDVRCYGLEYSPKSNSLVNEKLRSYHNWKSSKLLSTIPSSYGNNFFNVITFIETIEHLKDEMLSNTLDELNRLLKPGGKLVITTPFDESLIDSHVYCPFCDSEFHKMQHMRSFNAESMNELLASHGFTTVRCTNVNFMQWGPLNQKLNFYLRDFIQFLGFKKYSKNNRPHLVGIYTKQ